jgi:uncharacterized protein YndB with AHSA1/START domain
LFPKYTQANGALSMSCRVEINIGADAQTVWSLLVDAQGYPQWNSTVTGIDGQIREGSRIKIHVPGTKQTFTPKVSGVVPHQRMLWSNRIAGVFKGVRSFKLSACPDGSTDLRWRSASPAWFSLWPRRLCQTFIPFLRPLQMI